jgi:uncharacterized delta-60 repeat protein
MRRFISIMCILFSLLSVPIYVQPVTAGTSHTAQDTGNFFVISPATFTSPGKANTLIPLSDGRMLIGGSFVTIAGQATPRSLAIIKSDGSLDTTFQVDPNLQVNEIYAAALQPDGKIIIGGWFTKSPVPFPYLLRLYPNGTVDVTFQPYIFGQVFAILVDGSKIVIGGNFYSPTPYIARLNQDGTADSTFDGVGSGPSDSVMGIARQSNGKYIIVGEFGSFNGVSQVGLARLSASGSLDTSFAPGGFMASKRVAVLNDDSVVVGGENICASTGFFRWYNENGSVRTIPVVPTDPDPNILESITAFLPLSDGGFLIGGWYSYGCFNSNPMGHEGQVWRYASDGSYRTMTSFGQESDVLALALRSDGKVMLGGQGRPKYSDQVGIFDGLALLDLANNSLEKVDTFHPLVGDEAEIYSLSRYPDSKLLIAGNFSHVNGTPHFGLARLLANGTLDPSFHPFADRPGGWSYAALALSNGQAVASYGSSELYLIGQDGSLTDLSAINEYDRVSALAIQSDNKVLVGSDSRSRVRRLKADFSGEDDTFIPGDAYGAVYALAVQDNNIFVAGDFSKYNTVAVPGLVRLDSNGNIDSGFNPPVFMLDEYNTATLYSVTPLLNGNVLVGGNFRTVGGAEHPGLVRLTSTGALDIGFTSPTSFHTIKTVCVQGDGSIWPGGIENSSYRNPLVSHLSENGPIDITFQSVYQAAHYNGMVNAVLCDTGGLSWAGGRFSLIDGRPFYGLARYFSLWGQVFLPLISR